MGYFPNGSSGEEYESRVCLKCVHYNKGPFDCCPVWDLHQAWNYEQNKTTPDGIAKKHALDTLIPSDMKHKHPGVFPALCTMFIEAPPEPTTIDERFPDSVHPAYRKGVST